MRQSDLVAHTDALFRAIGVTVVRFQQIEQWLAEELALLLRMREKEDQYLVSAAMSFKQKVDLFVDLFPKRGAQPPKLPEVNVRVVRNALEKAEEFRNRVVHSFYAVECGEVTRWVRMKGSLKGRAGFSLNSVETNIEIFEKCNAALQVIRELRFKEAQEIQAAADEIAKHMRDGTI